MRIAVMNDLFFSETQLLRLRALADLALHRDTTTASQAIARIKSADIAVIDGFKVPITRAVIEAGGALRLIVLTSTAFHMADLGAAGERGVKIANIPNYSTEAVAEHAIALLFAVARHIPRSERAIRAEPFQIDPLIPSHRSLLGIELRGRTLGVIGLGAIGRRVAELGKGLGMTVVGYNRTPRPVTELKLLTLDELLAASDVVSLNLAVHPETIGFVSERELALMKPGAVLINTAGSELVDSVALHRALREGRLGGAGLDVVEPLDRTNPLLRLDCVVLSPQSAAWTREACANLTESVVATIEAFAHGRAINLVN